jgi:hypothetical protein
MGTSVNQRSPNTGGWRSVAACYTNETVSLDRTALEIWRAASTQDDEISTQLASPIVAQCAAAANRGLSEAQAVAEAEQLSSLKQNNLVTEFAKQALLIKAAGGYADESFTSVLFRQITNYLVSRDISAYVGPNSRCKTAHEARELKSRIAEVVARKVRDIERREQLEGRSWPEVCRSIFRQVRM